MEENKIQQEKIRKVFLERIPKKEGIGANKGKLMTDWNNSVGCSFDFQLDDLFGTIYILDIKKNKGKSKLLLQYKDKQLWMDSGHVYNCKFKNLVGLKTTDYTYNIGDIVENKFGKIKITKQIKIKINSSSRDNRTEKGYEYICLIDKNIDTISESHLNEGKGCNVCTNTKLMTGINDIATTHPHLIKYFPVGYEQASLYMIGTKESFYFKCPICGRLKTIKTRPFDIIKNKIESIGCICGSHPSYCEKFFYRMLELINIKFIKECGFDWLDSRRKYDFYFETNYNKYIVETDGYWHTHDNNMSGQTAEESIIIDNYKDEQAKLHGIEVIRIDCDFYGLTDIQKFNKIKTNIIENLSNILDLTYVDWNECDKFANTKPYNIAI
jgi:hypothetical protein